MKEEDSLVLVTVFAVFTTVKCQCREMKLLDVMGEATGTLRGWLTALSDPARDSVMQYGLISSASSLHHNWYWAERCGSGESACGGARCNTWDRIRKAIKGTQQQHRWNKVEKWISIRNTSILTYMEKTCFLNTWFIKFYFLSVCFSLVFWIQGCILLEPKHWGSCPAEHRAFIFSLQSMNTFIFFFFAINE